MGPNRLWFYLEETQEVEYGWPTGDSGSGYPALVGHFFIEDGAMKVSVFWFRRDLRWNDNHGLYKALKSGAPVLPLFIFDREILDRLQDRDDPRVSFIHRRLTELQAVARDCGGDLKVAIGKPLQVFTDLCKQHDIDKVFTNEDYEPYAIDRDAEVAQMLRARGIEFVAVKDQVIFAKNEIHKKDGKPYTVFTPYSRKWKERLQAEPAAKRSFASESELKGNLFGGTRFKMPPLESIGFKSSALELVDYDVSASLLKKYAERRDLPAVQGTSRLGLHLRFGTVSVREMVRRAEQHSEVWLNELIWREFFMSILFHFPHTASRCFRSDYDHIQWRNSQADFQRWCNGQTGYPLVDAGMRELNQTGFMHNRVRMVVASFLTKHLLIDWRWGEAYFARKLLDYEMSSNVENWQWAAGCGCDAAPYFRVFNPHLQLKKFDPEEIYVRQWLGDERMKPMVEHKEARERALRVYKEALQ